jgi:hypothetical protein
MLRKQRQGEFPWGRAKRLSLFLTQALAWPSDTVCTAVKNIPAAHTQMGQIGGYVLQLQF